MEINNLAEERCHYYCCTDQNINLCGAPSNQNDSLCENHEETIDCICGVPNCVQCDFLNEHDFCPQFLNCMFDKE